ncbi:MAG: hypothetical protein Q9186_001136 [Xanthomendoza sp. 1 TL-2023]
MDLTRMMADTFAINRFSITGPVKYMTALLNNLISMSPSTIQHVYTLKSNLVDIIMRGTDLYDINHMVSAQCTGQVGDSADPEFLLMPSMSQTESPPLQIVPYSINSPETPGHESICTLFTGQNKGVSTVICYLQALYTNVLFIPSEVKGLKDE